MSVSTRTLLVGTRPSRLARWQTDHVIQDLQAAWPGLDCRVVEFLTHGDKTLDRPLPEIGGKGVFTQELEGALRAGSIDLAVHSLKDLPIENAAGLEIGAICAREDAHDVLISGRGYTLAALPQGARVGTSSLRRAAQLLAARPDLQLASLRGNVDTRVRKAMQGEYDAIVLAAAGVLRLGLQDHIAERLPFDVMLPAPAQGAMAVQCRADDAEVLRLLAAIQDATTRAAVTAERAFLQGLGGGCSAPVAAYAHPADEEGGLEMIGLVASTDGRRVIRVSGISALANPDVLGKRLAEQALVQGAGDLLQ